MNKYLKAILLFIFFSIVAGAVGSFWYLRAAAITGNPVYPITLMYGEEVIFQGIYSPEYRSDRFPFHHIPDWLNVKLAQNKWGAILEGSMDPWDGFGEDPKWGGFGAVWGIMCVPAILLAPLIALFRQRPDWRSFVPMACMILGALWFPQHTWSRFNLPVLLLGFLAFGYILSQMKSKGESSNEGNIL